MTKNAKGRAKSAGPVKKAHNQHFCILCKTYGGSSRSHDTKYCKRHKVVTEIRKQSNEHMSVEELFVSSKKLSKKLKKLKKKCKRTYKSETSSNSDSD
eukprot:8104-Ditylum_brightwellii.AAC.1